LLWKVSLNDQNATVYRFLWLAANEHPICARVSKSGETVPVHRCSPTLAGPV
jgi:hypothetical protein